MRLLTVSAFLACAGNAAAQDTAPPPPAVPVISAPAQGALGAPSSPAQLSAPTSPPTGSIPVKTGRLLPLDTRVSIELAEAVSSNGRKRGDKFAIRLAAPIIVEGHILAPAGTVGVGEVVYAEAGGGGGSPGKLVLAARYIDVGAVRVRLKAFNLSAAGDSDFREMQVAAAIVGPLVMFVNGHDVLYPIGTRARAKAAEDVVLPEGPLASPPAALAPAPVIADAPTASTQAGGAVPAATVGVPTPPQTPNSEPKQ